MSDYKRYFKERYKKMLLEKDFDISREALDGIEDWKNVETNADTLSSLEDVSDDGVETLEVIDKDAWVEDDLQDSYDGKVILECVACHSRITVDQADVYEDEETQTACPNIMCPVCHAELGYTILGKIEKFNAPDEEEEKIEFPDEAEEPAMDEPVVDEPAEEEEEEEVEESLSDRIHRKHLGEAKEDVCPKCGKNPCECKESCDEALEEKCEDCDESCKEELEEGKDCKDCEDCDDLKECGDQLTEADEYPKAMQLKNNYTVKINNEEQEKFALSHTPEEVMKAADEWEKDYQKAQMGESLTEAGNLHITDQKDMKRLGSKNWYSADNKEYFDAISKDNDIYVNPEKKTGASRNKETGKTYKFDKDNRELKEADDEYPKSVLLRDKKHAVRVFNKAQEKFLLSHTPEEVVKAADKWEKDYQKAQMGESLKEGKKSHLYLMLIDGKLNEINAKSPEAAQLKARRLYPSADTVELYYKGLDPEIDKQISWENAPQTAISPANESLHESGDNLLFNIGTRFRIKGLNNVFKITWKDEFGNVTYKGISPRTRDHGDRLDSLEKGYEDGEIELLTPEQYESLTESVNNLSLDTDDTHLEMTADETGRISVISEPTTAPMEEIPETAVEGEDSIVPLDMGDMDEVEDNISPDEQNEIMDATEEEEVPAMEEEPVVDEEEEFEVEAESFNYLGNTFAKKLYENVNSYEMTSSKEIDGKLVVEGVIKFNSGKSKNTTFTFDEAKETRTGRIVLEGINPTFFNSKAFKLKGKLNEGKLICESLKYNYSINRLNESTGAQEPVAVRGIVRSK